MTAADHANTVREKVPHYVEGNLVTGATDVHSENCPGCAIEPDLDALQTQAETAAQERLAFVEAQTAMRERAEAAEAERDLAVRQRDDARDALRGYHDLMPALADCANECGEALLYSQAHQANDIARAALGDN